MNLTGLLFFLGINLLLLVLIIGVLLASQFSNRKREDIAVQLAQPLEMLGFKKQTWQTGLPSWLYEMSNGYYQAVIDGHPYEVHLYPFGRQRYATSPLVELVQLGYFNANVAVYSPGWEDMMPQLAWNMPTKLTLSAYEGLEIRTTDENSARTLLDEPRVRQSLLTLLHAGKTASVLVAPKDIHFTIQIDQPENLSAFTIRSWLKNMAEIAEVAVTLSSLNLEPLYSNHLRPQSGFSGARRLMFLVVLFLLFMSLILIAFFLLR